MKGRERQRETERERERENRYRWKWRTCNVLAARPAEGSHCDLLPQIV